MSEHEAAAADALLIRIGDRTLLVPLDAVETVVPSPRVTPVPATPPQMAGLFNHHGAIYPALHPLDDLVSDGRHAVVVRTRHHGRFALLCDWAEELVAAGAEEPLDLNGLAGRVVDAYRAVEPVLPPALSPTAVIRLRGRPDG